MTIAVSRPLRVATALALALLFVPLPAGAAGGGHGGGGMGGGMGGGHGFGGGIFHVRGGGLGTRGLVGQRPGGADAAGAAAPARAASLARGTAGARSATGPRGSRAGARRSRRTLRLLFARRLRLRRSRCDRTLYERDRAPHSCDTSRAYGRGR